VNEAEPDVLLPNIQAVLADALDRAVVFLAERQLPYGEIPIDRFGDAALAGEARRDSSPFATSIAVLALDLVAEHRLVPELRRRAQAFLLEEREAPGVWRYWSSRNGAPIDPDLDDTCCASFALAGNAARRGDNVTTILGNRHPSGLFKTWLRDPERNNDVDGVVNANVLLCLGERPETTAARDIVSAAINADREAQSTCYYLDPLALYHAVARAYAHGIRGFESCKQSVLTKIDASPVALSALSAALRVSTRLCFGADSRSTDRDVAYLLACQSAEGGFAREAFYSGPEPPAARSVWWGSEELTTALSLEALARYRSSRGARP
jgi:hypothetical protein